MFLLAVVSMGAAPIYTVSAIGGASGSRTEAFAINSRGTAVGTLIDEEGSSHGFGYDGRTSVFKSESEARDINDAGLIAGSQHGHATVWGNGESTNLGTLGGSASAATAISLNGSVTGGAARSDGRTHAFLYGNGTMLDLGTLGGDTSTGFGVNDAGQVVGSATTARGYEKAFLWDAQNGMRDLGTIGGTRARALAINAIGTAVGASMNSARYYHATVWDKSGSIIDLDTLGGSSSYAYGINSAGHVVGTSYDADGRQRAFVWTGGTLFDLNSILEDSAWFLMAAYGINDSGQIVGTGLYNGRPTAFQLDPLRLGPASDLMLARSTAVPEPSFSALLVCACGVAAFLKRNHT